MDLNSFLMQLLYPEKWQAWREKQAQAYRPGSFNDAQNYTLKQLMQIHPGYDNLFGAYDRNAQYEMFGPRDEPSAKVDRIESMGRPGMI